MISKTSRYAFRILGFLARQPEGRTRGEEIAAATGIPPNYLSKILNQLRKQGIVDSEKGWGGGFSLREEASHLPIRRVLEVFEGVEVFGADECVFGLPKCDAANPCPLHPFWERVRQALDEMTVSTTVGDLGRTTAKAGAPERPTSPTDGGN